jgi:hypothetical protein
MMTFGGGVKTVDGFGGDDQGGVKTKSGFASVKIVVDGFEDADDVDRFIKEIARDVLRAIAAGDDHGVDTQTASVLHAQRRIIVSDFLAVLCGFVGEGIATIGGGAKNCATTGQNAADGFLREFLCGLGPDKSSKAVADAETRMPWS